VVLLARAHQTAARVTVPATSDPGDLHVLDPSLRLIAL
jgi:hypothetical protein